MSDLPKGFFSATHAVLFEPAAAACSVCGSALEAPAEDDGDDTQVRGRGLLMWTRGDEQRFEEPDLCPGCASAIGVTAHQRWEIEEDEG